MKAMDFEDGTRLEHIGREEIRYSRGSDSISLYCYSTGTFFSNVCVLDLSGLIHGWRGTGYRLPVTLEEEDEIVEKVRRFMGPGKLVVEGATKIGR